MCIVSVLFWGDFYLYTILNRIEHNVMTVNLSTCRITVRIALAQTGVRSQSDSLRWRMSSQRITATVQANLLCGYNRSCWAGRSWTAGPLSRYTMGNRYCKTRSLKIQPMYDFNRMNRTFKIADNQAPGVTYVGDRLFKTRHCIGSMFHVSAYSVWDSHRIQI